MKILMQSLDPADTIEPLKRKRLAEFFGEHCAELILNHANHLDRTFGSASVVIREVMDGRASRCED
jgi:hypothetical protein